MSETATGEDMYGDDFGHELDCTICGGEGDCDDNADVSVRPAP